MLLSPSPPVNVNGLTPLALLQSSNFKITNRGYGDLTIAHLAFFLHLLLPSLARWFSMSTSFLPTLDDITDDITPCGREPRILLVAN